MFERVVGNLLGILESLQVDGITFPSQPPYILFAGGIKNVKNVMMLSLALPELALPPAPALIVPLRKLII